MLKKINRVLGLLGLKLIRPRRYAPKSEAQRVKEFVEEFNGPKVPLSDYMGECEWQNTPPVPNPGNEGRTHYVGDDCPGGHREGTENVAFGYVTKALVVNPNANFVPVDIGADDHEMTRTEHGEWKGAPPTGEVGPVGKVGPIGQCCGERPRVEQPNSDNKISGPTS